MSNYIIQNGELYHYGVPGMKWGVRKARAEAKANYKKEQDRIYKDTVKKYDAWNKKRDDATGNDIVNPDWHKRMDNENTAIREQHISNLRTASADYKNAMKQIKQDAKDANKQFKQDVKEWNADRNKYNLNVHDDGSMSISAETGKHYQKHLQSKGKEYADAVMKKANRKYTSKQVAKGTAVIAAILGGTALTLALDR